MTTTHRNRTTRTAAAALAAAALAAALAMTGCSGHTVTGTATAPPVSAMPQGTSSAGHARTTGMDVEKMWAETLDQCPRLPHVSAQPPEDPVGVGAADVWPGDAQVQATLADLRPSGSEEYTQDRLIDLRVVVVYERLALTNSVATAVGITQRPGRTPQDAIDTVRPGVENFDAAYKTDRDRIVGEINSGHRESAAEPNALSPLPAKRSEACE